MKIFGCKKINAFARCLAMTLVLLMLLTAFSSCKARRLSPTKDALTSVGTITVGNSDGTKTTYQVPYEEFYFLAKTYGKTVSEDFAEGTPEFNDALMELISENITANYAILALCADMGLTYDEKELGEEVKASVKEMINEGFGGSRGNYLRSIEELGMTDHYMRFVLGVDLLYSRLPALYTQNGLVPSTNNQIRDYVKDNFICTKHILIMNDEGDDVDENLAYAEMARALIENGKSINDLIGGKPMNVNEDLLIPYDGYYFAKGSMDEAYESAAFALKIGEVSEVVRSTAQNNSGVYVDCYYVIQRMPLDDKYVTKHLTDLSDSIAESVIANKQEELDKALSFVPNSYCLSLDLSELDAPKKGTDTGAIIATCSVVVIAVTIVTTALILSARHRKKLAKARAIKASTK